MAICDVVQTCNRSAKKRATGSGFLRRRLSKSGPDGVLRLGVSTAGFRSGFEECGVVLAFV
jgi:hypothetical protein